MSKKLGTGFDTDIVGRNICSMKTVTAHLPKEMTCRAKVCAGEHAESASKHAGRLPSERLAAGRGYGKAMRQWQSKKPRRLSEAGIKCPARDSLYE
jgi:hypothetical protein